MELLKLSRRAKFILEFMKKNSAYTLLQISKETGIPSIEVGNGLEELLKVEKVKKGSNGDNRTLWEKQEET